VTPAPCPPPLVERSRPVSKVNRRLPDRTHGSSCARDVVNRDLSVNREDRAARCDSAVEKRRHGRYVSPGRRAIRTTSNPHHFRSALATVTALARPADLARQSQTGRAGRAGRACEAGEAGEAGRRAWRAGGRGGQAGVAGVVRPKTWTAGRACTNREPYLGHRIAVEFPG
jgi:hypothetical protein